MSTKETTKETTNVMTSKACKCDNCECTDCKCEKHEKCNCANCSKCENSKCETHNSLKDTTGSDISEEVYLPIENSKRNITIGVIVTLLMALAIVSQSINFDELFLRLFGDLFDRSFDDINWEGQC